MKPTLPTLTLLYSPFPDATSANGVVRTMLAEKLIACANILPGVTSLYWWNDILTESTEVILIAKTDRTHEGAARARLADLHPYETPAVLAITAEANELFAQWLTRTLHTS